MIQPLNAKDFSAKVLQTDTPVVLDFFQERCPPCHVLTPRLERVAAEYEGRLPIYRIDIDHDMPLAERFRVMSLPTVLILENGQEVERLDGLIREDELRASFGRVAR